MGNQPIDLTAANQPIKKKAGEPKRPGTAPTTDLPDPIKQRESSAQQGAQAKFHQAVQKAGDAPITPSKPQQGNPMAGLADLAGQTMNQLGKAADQLGRARTDAVLAYTNYKPDDIVKKLPPQLVSDLARGKQLQDQMAANPTLKLTPEQKTVVDKYQQYHDNSVNSGLNKSGLGSVILDHKAMVTELDEAIARRYKSEHPVASSTPEVPGRNPEPVKGDGNSTDSQRPTSSSKTPSHESVDKAENSQDPSKLSPSTAASRPGHEDSTSAGTITINRADTRAGQSQSEKPFTAKTPGRAHAFCVVGSSARSSSKNYAIRFDKTSYISP